MSFKFLIAANLVLAALFYARIQPAFGHAYPIIVSPADGASLKESPREVRMQFTEGIELAFHPDYGEGSQRRSGRPR